MRETYSRNMAPAVRAEETVIEGDVGSVSTYRLSDLSFAIIGLWIPKTRMNTGCQRHLKCKGTILPCTNAGVFWARAEFFQM